MSPLDPLNPEQPNLDPLMIPPEQRNPEDLSQKANAAGDVVSGGGDLIGEGIVEGAAQIIGGAAEAVSGAGSEVVGGLIEGAGSGCFDAGCAGCSTVILLMLLTGAALAYTF